MWDGYVLNDFVPYWELWDLPRREARAEYNRVMGLKDHRLRQLRGLLGRSGVELDFSDRSVADLDAWFIEAMEPLVGHEVPNGRSLSVCEDIALFLGDLLIDRLPGLRWEFFIWGKKSMSYQNHVIYGYPGRETLRLNTGLSGMVHGYGVRVLEDRAGVREVVVPGLEGPFAGAVIELPPLDREFFAGVVQGATDRYYRDLSEDA
ncbi:hypothetical protein [Microbacterium sp.]|uniref:hypothetical protein n=1 Tax=Microbacterium sp. TaxID=51671 RepID=UPI00333FCB14